MKHTKILVLALLVALLACLAVSASADCNHPDTAWTEVQRVPATCTNDGYVTYSCTVCGSINTKTLYAKGAHTRSGVFECANPTDPACKPRVWVEICAVCKQHVFTDNQYTTAGDPTAHDVVKYTDNFKAPSCTVPGRAALAKCKNCGAINPFGEKYNGYAMNGAELKATGHDFSGSTWKQDKVATCGWGGKAYLQCANCTEKQWKDTPKTSFHTLADGTPITTWDFIEYMPAKPATCTEAGCKAIHKCPTCGAIDPLYNGAAIPALGHHMVVDQNSMTLPTCTKKGQTIMYCDRVINWGGKDVACGHMQVVESPALGHSATWVPVENQGDYVKYQLICSRCKALGGDGILASQLVRAGDKAPSGTVNTGKAATIDSMSATTSGLKEVAKKNTTKKTTKTSTAKKTTTTKTATTTKTETAAAATEVKAEGTKLVAGINNLEDKAVVVVKDGKATLVYAEPDVIVKIGETALEANVPVDVAADATATVAAADAAATK